MNPTIPYVGGAASILERKGGAMASISADYLSRTTWALTEAAQLLSGSDPNFLVDVTDATFGGRPAHIYANLKDATEDDGPLACKGSRTGGPGERRVRPWDAVQWAKAQGYKIPKELLTIPEPKSVRAALDSKPITATEAHVSDKLAILNQAARKFWGNPTVERDKRETHPTNQEVSKWLGEHKFPESLADKAATIIRPSWAGTGRKPEK